MSKKGKRLREFEKNNRVLTMDRERASRREEREISQSGEPVQGTSKKRKINWVKIISKVLALLFIAIIISSIKNIYDLKKEEKALYEKQALLIQIKEDLAMELENIDSDEYIEQQARKDLKLIKGNELIFFFSDDAQEEEK